MNVTPYLDKNEVDKHGRHKINLTVTFQGQRFREYTGERVKPKDWNDTKKLVKASDSMHTYINQVVSTAVDTVKKVWYELRHSQNVIDKEAFKDAIKRARFPEKFVEEKQKVTLIDFITKFQKDFTSQLSSGYLANFKQLKGHFEGLNPDLKPSDMSLEQLNEYIAYCADELGLSDNTISNNLIKLRRVLSYAIICGHTVPASYELATIKTYDADRIFLTTEELALLHNFIFDDPELHLTQGRFLLACYTGFRYSDLTRLAGNIVEWKNYQTFEIRQKKTSDPVRVAMNDYATEIWDRYEGKLLDGFKDRPIQHYNGLIKEMCKQVGINASVTISEMRKGDLVEYTCPKYEVMSSHSARHTFAVQSILRNMDIFVLKDIMGHASVTSTERYARIVDSMKHEKMLQHWKKEVAG